MTTKTKKQKKLTPELRFPEFFGEWEEKRLGEVCYIKTGKLDANAMVENGKYRFYTCAKNYYKINNYAFDTEALLVSGNGANVGYVHYYFGKFNAYQRTYVLDRFDQNIFFVKYFLDQFLSIRISKEKKDGNTPYIVMETLTGLKINIPALGEQKKIATFLSAVDEKIGKMEKKKALLVEYKKGVMQKIFSQEIRFKDKDGKSFPDWEEKKLGEVVEVNPSQVVLPKQFVYIDLESVKKGILKQENEISKNGAPSRAQRVLKKKDILFQTVRPYQQNNLLFNLDGDYVASTGYAQIRTKQVSEYLYYSLHATTFLNMVLARSTGSNYPAINSGDLKKIKVNLPSLEEQKKIASFLTAIDERIKVVEEEIEGVKEWKRGLLQKMFV